MYNAEDATDVFQQHSVRHQMFADDMQGLTHGKLNKVAVSAAELGSCASAVNDMGRIKAPPAKYREDRGPVVWVCNEPQENSAR